MTANSKLKLDALAASYLDQDVAEARAHLDEITRDIEKLQAKRRAIEWKIERLSANSQGIVKAESPSNGANGSNTHGGDRPVHNGFRDTIRKVMREAGRGLRTKEISELILKSGFEYTAKTALSTRVSSDLSRLIKSGDVSQKRGLYSINQERQESLLQ
jgi:hypothetical protein